MREMLCYIKSVLKDTRGSDTMNKQRLLEKMQENRISITEMYSRLGISRSAFYRKCNGLSEFTLDEIKKIMAILGENDPREIFFEQKVS